MLNITNIICGNLDNPRSSTHFLQKDKIFFTYMYSNLISLEKITQNEIRRTYNKKRLINNTLIVLLCAKEYEDSMREQIGLVDFVLMIILLAM